MNVPLARDQNGNPFTLPPEAEFWRVRRQTGGRPSTVLGPDGEPLFVVLTSDKPDLRSYGCNGSIRLEAVDHNHKPVSAPVAFVELGDEQVQRAVPATDNADLVRGSVEALTRTMEAMQRAQVERERALAQKERALADSQVARDRMFADLVIALLERSGNGKPQDPVAVLKQQLAFQKTLEHETGRRNAQLVAPEIKPDEGKPPTWLDRAMPFAPLVATGIQEIVVKSIANDDPAKAERLREDFKRWTQIAGHMAGAPAPQFSMGGGAVEQPDSRPTPSKPVRQLMAILDDEEAAAFDEFLDRLSHDEHAQLGTFVESLGTVENRVAWARSLLSGEAPQSPADTSPPAESASERRDAGGVIGQPSASRIADVPLQLAPVLMQLSDDERIVASQIVEALDRGTIQMLTDRLIAMPPERALRTIRNAINDARRRSPSVAQRAVAEALHEEEESRPNGHGSRPNGTPPKGDVS
jgi:hypothetical protein